MHDARRRPATRVLPPLPFALALLAAWFLHRDVLAWPLPLGRAGELAGWGLIGAGLLLFVWTMWVFWRQRTTVNPFRAASTLVVHGPFRYSRNPIYVGDWLVYAGVMLLMHTAWPLAFAPLVWGILRYGVLRHEEAHLEAVFGDDYRAYKRRVRRWI